MTNADKSTALLRRIPIFSSLTDADLQRIVTSPVNKVVDFGPMEDIIREDEVADCMYVILEGAVDVRIRAVAGREITIATLKAGDFFGEQALLPGASGKRNASVRSLQKAKLFRIGKSDVLYGYRAGNDQPQTEEDLSNLPEEERVKRLLQSNRLFRSLSPEDFTNLSQWVEITRFTAGEMILREADEGDFMYIVLDGSVEVFIIDDDGKVVMLSTLSRGHYFGEQAMLPRGSGRRNANVRAIGEVTLVKVAKEYFRLVLGRDSKLMLALQVIGEAQRKKITEVLGHSPTI
jgi:CRP-like cAMP-binding protein